MKTKPAARFKVGELAERAGVSVRALHHYDEIGLLCPDHSASGHRLYGDVHVDRLLRIKALRQVGFALDDITRMLNTKNFSLRDALATRLERLREEMAAREALLRKLEWLTERIDSNQAISTETLFQTLEDMMRVESYFTPEQLKEIEERRNALGEEAVIKSQEDWRILMDEVKAEIAKGTDLASPRVQELADRWHAMVQAFTGGNPEIAKAVRTMMQREERIHGVDSAEVLKLGEFIIAARAAKTK